MVFFDKITDLDKGDVTDHICLNFSEKIKIWDHDGEFSTDLKKSGIITKAEKNWKGVGQRGGKRW